MKLAIIGSRTETISLNINSIINYIPINCNCIISGGAEGVDKLAETAAAQLNIPIKVFLPDYSIYGKNAPLIRNKLIADYCDYLIAFWDFKSTGTAHTISYCIEHSIPFHIFPIDEIKIK